MFAKNIFLLAITVCFVGADAKQVVTTSEQSDSKIDSLASLAIDDDRVAEEAGITKAERTQLKALHQGMTSEAMKAAVEAMRNLSNTVKENYNLERKAKYNEWLGRIRKSLPQERWDRLEQIQKNMDVFHGGFSTLIAENEQKEDLSKRVKSLEAKAAASIAKILEDLKKDVLAELPEEQRLEANRSLGKTYFPVREVLGKDINFYRE